MAVASWAVWYMSDLIPRCLLHAPKNPGQAIREVGGGHLALLA